MGRIQRFSSRLFFFSDVVEDEKSKAPATMTGNRLGYEASC